jgi:hypothetical protein
MAIWLVVTFVLIALSISNPATEYYTGGLLIASFIIALLYVFGNAVRQGRELDKTQLAPPPPQAMPPAEHPAEQQKSIEETSA